jgi:hypothetical protein
MVKLGFWEQFIIQAAVSLLTVLASQVSNQAELAALQAGIQFLQKLLAGQVSTTWNCITPAGKTCRKEGVIEIYRAGCQAARSFYFVSPPSGGSAGQYGRAHSGGAILVLSAWFRFCMMKSRRDVSSDNTVTAFVPAPR